MKVHLPYGETTIEAGLPENTRLLSDVEQAVCPKIMGRALLGCTPVLFNGSRGNR
jgi:hypothetical protein